MDQPGSRYLKVWGLTVILLVIWLVIASCITSSWKDALALGLGLPVVGVVSLFLAVYIQQFGGLVIVGIMYCCGVVVAAVCRLICPKRFVNFAAESPVHPIMFFPFGLAMFGILYLLIGDFQILVITTVPISIGIGWAAYLGWREETQKAKAAQHLAANSCKILNRPPHYRSEE